MQLFTDFLIFEMFLVSLLDNKREKITLRLAQEIKIYIFAELLKWQKK